MPDPVGAGIAAYLGIRVALCHRLRFGGRAAAGAAGDVERVIGRGDTHPELGVDCVEGCLGVDLFQRHQGHPVDQPVERGATDHTEYAIKVGIANQNSPAVVEIVQLAGVARWPHGGSWQFIQDDGDLRLEPSLLDIRVFQPLIPSSRFVVLGVS